MWDPARIERGMARIMGRAPFQEPASRRQGESCHEDERVLLVAAAIAAVASRQPCSRFWFVRGGLCRMIHCVALIALGCSLRARIERSGKTIPAILR